MTPERLLEAINKIRRKKGIYELDPNVHIIPTIDLNKVSKKFKVLEIKDVKGDYLADPGTWIDLMNKNCLIAPYHQMFYFNKTFMDLPMVQEIGKSNKSSLDKFKRFVDEVVKFYGPFDHGHVDLVMDLKEDNGRLNVILANLSSTDNKYPIRLDWHLFSKYMFWDTLGVQVIYSSEQIPPEPKLKKLKEVGRLKHKKVDFEWGGATIFSEYTGK